MLQRSSHTPKSRNQTVGDSPRGPLKQLGNPHLKPATKPKPSTPYLTMQDVAHAAKAPTAHQEAHPKIPSSRLRLARGRAPPSDGLRSVRGARLPRAGSASLEGPLRPRTGSASLEGIPLAHACSRTRAFNALTSAGQRHHAPGARAPVPPHQLPRREPIPTTVGGTVRRGRCQSRDAAPPAPVRLTCRALEGGPAAPSICFSCDPAGLGGGARPVGQHPCHC
jgi:hypothetical protein